MDLDNGRLRCARFLQLRRIKHQSKRKLTDRNCVRSNPGKTKHPLRNRPVRKTRILFNGDAFGYSVILIHIKKFVYRTLRQMSR